MNLGKHFGKRFADVLIMTAGAVIFALTFNLFLEPNRIAPGGVSGIAIIINYLTGLSIGQLILIMNIPLLIAGYLKLGFRFILKTLYVTVLSSVMIDATAGLPTFTTDPLLASLYGGAMMGIGLGMVLMTGATTGGADILVRLMRIRFRNLKIGQLMLIVDAAVITASAFAFYDVNRALYGAITTYIGALVMDSVIYRFDFAHIVYIISDKNQEISEWITNELSRGVTFLKGSGGFTKGEKDIILCAVKRQETPKLREMVAQIDEDAFMIVTEAHEVLGMGFQRHNDKNGL